MSAAHVIYISRKLESARSPWSLSEIRGEPCLAHLIRRLTEHRPCYLLCHEPETAELLSTLEARAVIRVAGIDRLQALVEFARSGTAATLMVYSENALFPDCELASLLLREHLDSNADATFAGEYPPGFVPEIYQAEALPRIAALGLSGNQVWDLKAAMERANRGARDGGTVFRVHCFDSARFVNSPRLERLGSSLLILSGHARSAAEQVLDEGQLDSGATAAYRFRELLGERFRGSAALETAGGTAPGARRVLFCSLATLYGGAEESLYLLISNLDRARYHPLVVLPRRSVLSEKLEAADVEVLFPEHEIGRLTPYSLDWFQRLLRMSGARLVHIDSFVVPSLVMAAHRLEIPILHHVRFLHGRRAPEIFQFSTKVIAVSEATRRDLLRSDLDENVVVTIENGLDLSRFHPHPAGQHVRGERGIAADAFVLVTVARICEKKRHQVLLAALPELIRSGVNPLAIFAGEVYPDDVAYFQELQRTIERDGLGPHVQFWGFEKNIAELYAMSDALVLCSDGEAFGRCIIEAMAMGVPVIVPDRAGPAEIVTHGETGLLFDAARPAELARQVATIYSDADLRARLSARGVEHARRYDIRRHVREVQALYDSIQA